MLEALKDYKGEIEVNGEKFDSVERAESLLKTISGPICIKLCSNAKNANTGEFRANMSKIDDATQYIITVKAYMTKEASPEFDFMAKWNDNNPMPLRTMQGIIEKETRGMVYMKLHGFGERTITCMCCGKELKNPISRHYGIGPVCMGKVGIVADIEDVDTIKEELEKIEWKGWVIRSSIIDKVEVK